MSGKKVHSHTSAGSIFSRFCTLQFLLVPKIIIESQGLSFLNTLQCSEGCNDTNKTLTEADFQSCYEVWKNCWPKSVALEGFYFEGDSIDLDK
jgi:hypothetical protein